ncbi:hypothetical protein ZWY2020_046990, partial [Hordeum vulgare]
LEAATYPPWWRMEGLWAPGVPPGLYFLRITPSDPEKINIYSPEGFDLRIAQFSSVAISSLLSAADLGQDVFSRFRRRDLCVKQDGSVSHFFHGTFKAYNTRTRKRRKINTGDLADVRWHKTGKTKPVIVDGQHLGCKKIMVLYMSTVKAGKPKKTNWVMHQYHLGTSEDEQNGEYVVSKLFFQQQSKPGEKSALELTNTVVMETIVAEGYLPDLPEPTMEEEDERISSISNQEVLLNNEYNADEEALHSHEHSTYQENGDCEINMEEKAAKENVVYPSSEKPEDGDNPPSQDPNLWESDSQFLLDSQQLAENLAICDEFVQSQSSCGDGDEPRIFTGQLYNGNFHRAGD